MKHAMILLAFAGSVAAGFAHAQTTAPVGKDLSRSREQVQQELIRAQQDGQLNLLQSSVYRGSR